MQSLVIPDELRRFFRSHRAFFILSHLEPDGDCVGSALALRSFLRRTGKVAETYNVGPFDRTEIRPYRDEFQPAIPADMLREYPDAAVVVVDSSSFDRIGEELQNQVRQLPIAVIDHHAAGHPFGSVRMIDPSIPATSLMVQRIIEDAAGEVTPDEAKLLFLGLITDTGFFRFLEAGSGEVFSAAGRLVTKGASPRKTFRSVSHGRSLQSRKHLGRLLERAESYMDGRFFVSHAPLSDEQEFGVNQRDSDSLYSLLLSIEGCEAIAFLREIEPGITVGSLRSAEHIDVSRIALQFGGGGHPRAAGFKLDQPIPEVKQQVVELLRAACTDHHRD
ncbi:DHH family phosphoesterase [Spirochaeta africana]|uniref:Exopolyphosphatase-like enzyme n=1 Tax=Spirochaeta africana (strain ATCC 700263 / DSM 8902 / Z-7692) TaxID=889378 RepID=H9UI76_SPIAZ|nr:bifunctional oligoribonuclease/PAP phosphatase NrnA [Spirochaeta africana]AFG37219.1 exopolyphosphatase-like enzyme [Spirochaeta africana DSM 8902]